MHTVNLLLYKLLTRYLKSESIIQAEAKSSKKFNLTDHLIAFKAAFLPLFTLMQV